MGGTGSKIENAVVVETKWFDNYITNNLLPSQVTTENCFTGKTIAITGTTSGTGYVLAETCIKNGCDNVLLLNRQSTRSISCEGQLREIGTKLSSKTNIDSIPCDLQDFSSVRSAINVIKTKYDSIDILCNNAGVMAVEDLATIDGYDIQMQTNHLSHFLLTTGLFPLLQKAVEKHGEARIVNHSSMARHGSALDAKYFEKNGGKLGGNSPSLTGPRYERYHQTKLANAAFTLELSKRLSTASSTSTTKGIKAVAAAPGFAATQLQVTASDSGGMSARAYKLISCLAQSPEDGTLPLLAACFDRTTDNGDFWEPNKIHRFYGPPGKVSFDRNSLKDDQRSMLWTKSEEACGVEFKI